MQSATQQAGRLPSTLGELAAGGEGGPTHGHATLPNQPGQGTCGLGVDAIANNVAASPSQIARALCTMNWSGMMRPSNKLLQAMAMADAWAAVHKHTVAISCCLLMVRRSCNWRPLLLWLSL